MHYLRLLISTLVLAYDVTGQTVCGRLMLNNQLPAPYILVTAFQNGVTTGRAITDSAGRFSMHVTDTNDCTLVIRHVPKNDTIHASPSADGWLEYILGQHIVMFTEIQVCEAPIEYGLGEPDNYILTREEIERMPY